MKRTIVLGLLLVAAVLGFSAMPRMVESTIPTAYYITPSLTTYENVIQCTGTIQSEDVRQIVLQSSIVAEEVFAAVGDQVAEGAPLVKVDREKTGTMGLSMSLIRDISDDIGAVPSVEGVDWAGLAASYGLSAVASGGTALDAGTLEGFLNDNGLLTSANAVPALEGFDGEGEITAPIAGVVTGVDIQKGIPAAAGKAICTIADDRNYKVLVSIREEDVGRVQVGDGAKVRGVGFPGAVYEGVVTKIYPTARKSLSAATSETVVDAEVALKNPDSRLKLGFSAKVEILGGNDCNLVTVPYEAIKQDESNNEYVYLYQDGKLKKQLVVTGQELTDEVEILEGVSHDSVVVYNPSDAIKEGTMVHLRGRAGLD